MYKQNSRIKRLFNPIHYWPLPFCLFWGLFPVKVGGSDPPPQKKKKKNMDPRLMSYDWNEG